ncbi:hypothetical protein LOTGIDRAFT_155767 [Lottia gigantea]|uniref:Uncharacterized protein n=1 Tax=Lottia gigantea TaxID=225164 RepID=V4B2N1_LOTGI|nr:hypothetical protein LOTGIDRAFT_155767 [Lottia gigantea]ESO82749.1 hypothetical protein LOTGIDRAFT_155767 [Lottia gigantea]
MAKKILDPIFRLYDPIRYSFNKKKEDYIIISPTVGSKSQLNDVGRITFEINSLSNWLVLSDAYFRCDFKIKEGTQNQVPQTNTTLENNFFPSLFSEMVLEAGSNSMETIKHPGEFDTMLTTVLYPIDFDSVSGWIPDVGDGSVLKEPVRNLANDADLARVRIVARNTIERVARAANHGFEKRVLQYNNIVENNRWGNYVNWKLYPLFGLLEHRKVSIGLPYKIHLQREINDDKIFFGENSSDAKLEITNLQLFIHHQLNITKKLIDKYKYCKVRDDIDLERIDANAKEGGFLPFLLPLIFGGIAAAGAATGGISAAVKAANTKKSEDAKAAEERRHKLIMEKEAKGSGVGDMISTIKEFGKRFGEETKKTVKQGLNKLVESIDTGEVKVKHKGNGIFLKNIHTGEGIFLSKYKGGVVFGIK